MPARRSRHATSFSAPVGVSGGAEKIGVADEKALLVVVDVDEPQCDRFRATGFNLVGLRLERIDAFDLGADLVSVNRLDLDVRLAENDEKITGTGVLEFACHVQVRIHTCLEHRDAADLIELDRSHIELNPQAITTSKPTSAASRAA